HTANEATRRPPRNTSGTGASACPLTRGLDISVAKRYRLDTRDARRDVKLARSLPQHLIVAAALTDPAQPLHPAKAAVITAALDRIAARVPVEHRDIAEEQLVKLAAHLAPSELAKSTREICELLDSDGPEPDENAAYARESLILIPAEGGVKFRGYLAKEHAELLCSTTDAGARPHKTPEGELDPRSRAKRQADALTDTLLIAAAAMDAASTPPAGATARSATTADASETAPTASATPPEAEAAATAQNQSSTADNASRSEAEAAAGTQSSTADNASRSDAEAAAGNQSSTAESVEPAGGGDGSDTAIGAGAAGAADKAADTPTIGAGQTGVKGNGAGVGGRAAGVDGSGARTRGAGPEVGGAVPGYGAKATITVTIDYDDLKAATARATGDLVYCDGLSAATIRRLACDAKIIPLVIGSTSEPLDVGRSQRLVTRAMRRALNARDKGCVICGAPPIHCDAHHLQSWIDGGATATHNLVLLCRGHAGWPAGWSGD
ncbi:DUF222 domain-containing protein, partial [Kribbella sp. NPDC055071]